MPIGKTGANNNTLTGYAVTGCRASWPESSKPVKKKKQATNE